MDFALQTCSRFGPGSTASHPSRPSRSATSYCSTPTLDIYCNCRSSIEVYSGPPLQQWRAIPAHTCRQAWPILLELLAILTRATSRMPRQAPCNAKLSNETNQFCAVFYHGPSCGAVLDRRRGPSVPLEVLLAGRLYLPVQCLIPAAGFSSPQRCPCLTPTLGLSTRGF